MRVASWVAVVALLAADSAVHAERRSSATRLAWLAGCWAYVGAAAGSGETWMPPAGGELLGVARHVRDGRVVSYEFERIVEEGHRLFLISSPAGGADVRFALESLTATQAVFGNRTNEFPQRVIYRLSQSGDISARREGAASDPRRALDFPMRRTSCEQARDL
jgi:hypothetical protein